MELGQIGQATVSGGARTYYVHHQCGSEWGSATPLVDAFQAAAAAGKGAQVIHLPCVAARRLEDYALLEPKLPMYNTCTVWQSCEKQAPYDPSMHLQD